MRCGVWYISCWMMVLAAVACNNNNTDKLAVKPVQHESLPPVLPRDTPKIVTPPDSSDFEDCNAQFFNKLPRFKDSNAAWLLLKDGKRVSITQFFRDEYMGDISNYGLKDLDKDGIPELIIFNYTGGAHCCDEYYVFQQTAPSEYGYKAHLIGGDVCIDASTNAFGFSFSEALGYFFGCYACGFEDSTSVFKRIRQLNFQYRDGKFVAQAADSITDAQLNTNLQVLQHHGYEAITDGLMDNGSRKEFAMNFAVWHYSHGKNWDGTKKLFDRYYTFKDAGKIWKEFRENLLGIEKQNSF